MAPTDIFLDCCAPDQGRSGGNYTASDIAAIENGWHDIADYFSEFDVNVTTIMPNVSTTPTAWELISDTFSGGASYVGVFPNTTDDSWVNSYMTSSRTSGMAHELGHNFGMSHQRDFNLLGVETNEYTYGYDSLHGAIMGYDPGQLVHKWYLGHTAATTLEDDVAIVANDLKVYDHGDGMAPDDAGNTIGTATAMTVNGSVQSYNGVIERLTDQDAYSFTSTGGIYTVAATPTGVFASRAGAQHLRQRRQPPVHRRCHGHQFAIRQCHPGRRHLLCNCLQPGQLRRSGRIRCHSHL